MDHAKEQTSPADRLAELESRGARSDSVVDQPADSDAESAAPQPKKDKGKGVDRTMHPNYDLFLYHNRYHRNSDSEEVGRATAAAAAAAAAAAGASAGTGTATGTQRYMGDDYMPGFWDSGRRDTVDGIFRHAPELGAGNGPRSDGPGNRRRLEARYSFTISSDTAGYCLVRSDGSRTRLVPADMLPYPLEGVPAREPPSDRLIPLPVPSGVGPDGRSSNTEPLKPVSPPPGMDIKPVGCSGGGNEPSSSHRPPPACRACNSASCCMASASNNGAGSSNGSRPNNNNNNNHNGNGNGKKNGKPAKVYCDKWVHEGVCAFTQQGCRFLHEMPLDTATQHQLGLFRGLPLWYRKQTAELSAPQPYTNAAVRSAAANVAAAATAMAAGLTTTTATTSTTTGAVAPLAVSAPLSSSFPMSTAMLPALAAPAGTGGQYYFYTDAQQLLNGYANGAAAPVNGYGYGYGYGYEYGYGYGNANGHGYGYGTAAGEGGYGYGYGQGQGYHHQDAQGRAAAAANFRATAGSSSGGGSTSRMQMMLQQTNWRANAGPLDSGGGGVWLGETARQGNGTANTANPIVSYHDTYSNTNGINAGGGMASSRDTGSNQPAGDVAAAAATSITSTSIITSQTAPDDLPPPLPLPRPPWWPWNSPSQQQQLRERQHGRRGACSFTTYHGRRPCPWGPIAPPAKRTAEAENPDAAGPSAASSSSSPAAAAAASTSTSASASASASTSSSSSTSTSTPSSPSSASASAAAAEERARNVQPTLTRMTMPVPGQQMAGVLVFEEEKEEEEQEDEKDENEEGGWEDQGQEESGEEETEMDTLEDLLAGSVSDHD